MGKAFLAKSNGGGASLNFDVKAYATEAELLTATPKENTIGIVTATAISGWDFSATEPYRRSSNRNLNVYPYYHTTRTENGITFKANSNGTITVNGTASADTYFRIHYAKTQYMLELEPGTYTLSDVAGSSKARTELLVSYDNQTSWTTVAHCSSSGEASFTIPKKAIARMALKVYSGTTLSAVVFKPQLEKGSSATSFVKGNATGQVWISTGTSSTVKFNALKKNSLQVYPISAKQYVSGSWVDVTAMSYQNGTWVSWLTYLFNKGTVNTELTGGIYGTNSGTALEFVRAYLDPAESRNYTTKSAVDIGNYSKLKARFTSTGTNANAFFRIYADDAYSDGATRSNSALSAYTVLNGPFNGDTFTVEVNLSELAGGSYYIGYGMGVLSASSGSLYVSGSITEWWFE